MSTGSARPARSPVASSLSVRRAVARLLSRRGLEVRRHPAARRQRVLVRHGVDLVIDVGAAGGGYGDQLREFGYAGRIVSFEPLSAAHARLTRHIEHDPQWTAYHLGLGDEPGTTTINIASNSDSSSLLPMLDAHIEAAPEVTYVDSETATLARLDDLADDVIGDARRPFLKVDTQGFERRVLGGATETLTRCAGLQLELSLTPLYSGAMLIDEAISTAYALGFEMVGVEQGYAAPTGEILQIDGVFVRGTQ